MLKGIIPSLCSGAGCLAFVAIVSLPHSHQVALAQTSSPPAEETESDPAPSYVNEYGTWTLDMSCPQDGQTTYIVSLNNAEAFRIDLDLFRAPQGGLVELTVDGRYSACVLSRDVENQTPCQDYVDLAHDPLLAGGALSVAELIAEWRTAAQAQAEPIEDGGAATMTPPCWGCGVGSPSGDCSAAPINLCCCATPSWELCMECCEEKNPLPYPGGSGPWENLMNCIAECDQDSCACQCSDGWFCGTHWRACYLYCIPFGPWS